MQVTLIGYGEVGRILAEDLRAAGVAVSACDLKLASDAGQAMREHAARHGVMLAGEHAAAVRGAGLVVSAGTASQSAPAAEAGASGLAAGAWRTETDRIPQGLK